jgi:hypothetical protein
MIGGRLPAKPYAVIFLLRDTERNQYPALHSDGEVGIDLFPQWGVSFQRQSDVLFGLSTHKHLKKRNDVR